MSTKENTQAWMAWYHAMSDEEKKAHNKERYRKYKERSDNYNKQWAKDNPHKVYASVHQSFVKRNYPEAFNQGDIATPDLAEYLRVNRGRECAYCSEPAYYIVHKIPLSRGGTHTWDNILLTCKECNQVKKYMTHEEYMNRIQNLIKKFMP